MSQSEAPTKRDVLLVLLEQASVFIHLDPRRDGVVVPPWFKKQAQLVLQIGLNMAVPIRDLDVGEAGVSCTLSFNRSPFFCYLPYTSVFGLVGEDGQARLWPEDIPPEVLAQMNEAARREAKKRKDRARLRAVDEGAGSPASEPAPAPETVPAPAVAVAPQSNAPSDSSESSQPQPPGPSPAGATKKRSLPPYLRVVK